MTPLSRSGGAILGAVKRSRRVSGILVVILFAAVELLSPLPAFHRHSNEIGSAAPSSIRMASGVVSSGSGHPTCPACAIFGLSALAPFGTGPTVSAATAARVRALVLVFPISFDHRVDRGRAPPLS
jgi:hypothetical protein